MTTLYEPAQNGELMNCSNCKHSREINHDASTYCSVLSKELGIIPVNEMFSIENLVKTAEYFYCNFHERK